MRPSAHCPRRVVTSACGTPRQALRKARTVPAASRTTSDAGLGEIERRKVAAARARPARGRRTARRRGRSARVRRRRRLHPRAPQVRPALERGKFARKDRTQVRHAASPGERAIDIDLFLEGEALPQHFEHADQPERHGLAVEVPPPARRDHAVDQVVDERGEVRVLLPADGQVFLARARLAPERVPDRDLARTGDIRVEVQLDQPLQRERRLVAQCHDGRHDALLELRGEELQRCHEHRGLGRK